jgi:hypothetical protein
MVGEEGEEVLGEGEDGVGRRGMRVLVDVCELQCSRPTTRVVPHRIRPALALVHS